MSYPPELAEEWRQAVDVLQGRPARTGIVLGSGLGEATAAFDVDQEVAYDQLPGLPKSTVPGHSGTLLHATIGQTPVWVAKGRVHLYEGRPPQEVSAMIRLMAACGVERLLLTNAAGGLSAGLQPGGWMVLEDHLNLTGRSPLEGGPHFIDMQGAYDQDMRDALRRAADRLRLPVASGVYAGLPGPQYETPAEVKMLGKLGADAVGMSTVLECIQARALGIRVAGISLITNLASGIGNEGVDHSEVLTAGANAAEALGRWLTEWLGGSSDP